MSVDAAYHHCLELGLAASVEQRPAAALAHFAQASALAPASGVPHLLMGAEHACRGDLALAEVAYAQALWLAPGLHLARYQLGLMQFGAQRTSAAVATWQPLLALCDSEPLGHFVRGFAALVDDDYAAAVRHFRRGLALSRDQAAAALGVGTVVEAIERVIGTSPAGAERSAAGAAELGPRLQ
jgi:Flp pilus assembly protein TadD